MLKKLMTRLLAAPMLILCASLSELDEAELSRAVEKRTARAEKAVVRDYLTRHGVEGDEAEEAMDGLLQRLHENQPTKERLFSLTKRAEKAENELQRTRFSSRMALRLAQLGVPEKNAEDVLLLAERELEQNGAEGDENAAADAVDAVITRLPALAENKLGAGAKGNYPRPDDTRALYSRRLESARAAGDNASAVKIITEAAEKGITLR